MKNTQEELATARKDILMYGKLNYILVLQEQFKKCHACKCLFISEGTTIKHTIFYSYTTPKIIIFDNGLMFRFEYENSRKAGAKTTSQTTTKQCNQFLRELGTKLKLKDLPEFNLGIFEQYILDTRLEKYF